jgi:exodeoxyribonuclease VIII
MTYKLEQLYNKVIKPGIYINMPIDIYHNDMSLSVSGMKNILNTPLHYWHNSGFNKNRENIETPALKTGKLLHTMLLEPEKFNQLYIIKNNVYSSKVQGFIGEGEYNEALNMINIIKENPFYDQFVTDGFAELSIFWICDNTKVPCKIRIDYLNNYIVDYKTTTSINENFLKSTILKYKYHLQAAFYLYGINQIKKQNYKIYNYKNKNNTQDCNKINELLQKDINQFIFLFQEKHAPYICNTIDLCADFLTVGAEQAKTALELYKFNFEKSGFNQWQTNNDNITTLEYNY